MIFTMLILLIQIFWQTVEYSSSACARPHPECKGEAGASRLRCFTSVSCWTFVVHSAAPIALLHQFTGGPVWLKPATFFCGCSRRSPAAVAVATASPHVSVFPFASYLPSACFNMCYAVGVCLLTVEAVHAIQRGSMLLLTAPLLLLTSSNETKRND